MSSDHAGERAGLLPAMAEPKAGSDFDAADYPAIAAFSAASGAPSPKLDAFGDAVRHLDLMNVCAPYWR